MQSSRVYYLQRDTTDVDNFFNNIPGRARYISDDGPVFPEQGV
jgi:hypothetical protein